MHRGYVKLWRKSFDSGMMTNANLWLFWTWCLLKASHKKTKVLVGFQEVELNQGDLVFGRQKAAAALNFSERTVRSCLETLKNSKQIAIKTTSKYSIISIINWDTYQSIDNESGQQNDQHSDQQTTSRRPASDQQATTNNNVKECKEEIYPSSEDEVDRVKGDGIDFLITKKKRKLNGKRFQSFTLFWEAFNYKQGKREAADAWYDIPQLTDALVAQIVKSAKAEADNRKDLIAKGKTPKMAQGWISGRRWEDEQAPGRRKPVPVAVWG